MLSDALDAGTVDRVVVDMRYLRGGDGSVLLGLVADLAGEAQINTPAGLTVIIGRENESAATMIATEFDLTTEATFVGEMTPARADNFGCPCVDIPLPASGYIFSVPLSRAGNGDERMAIEPDIPVALTSTDFFAGRDPAGDGDGEAVAHGGSWWVQVPHGPGARQRPSGIGHITALDGLRAWRSGRCCCSMRTCPDGAVGYLGVDLLIAVASGWLTTSLLLDEWDCSRRIDVIAFWGRRMRRLFAAVLVLIVVVTVWWWRAGPAEQRWVVRDDARYALLYVANWHQLAASGNYWATTSAPSPLAHLWSPAIEEQF